MTQKYVEEKSSRFPTRRRIVHLSQSSRNPNKHFLCFGGGEFWTRNFWGKLSVGRAQSHLTPSPNPPIPEILVHTYVNRRKAPVATTLLCFICHQNNNALRISAECLFWKLKRNKRDQFTCAQVLPNSVEISSTLSPLSQAQSIGNSVIRFRIDWNLAHFWINSK